MNRLLMPSGLALDEHYCRRWLVIRLLRELEQQQVNDLSNGHPTSSSTPHVGVQMSGFLVPRHTFLCFGFARSLALAPALNSSAIIGFQVDETAREVIQFLEDPAIPSAVINETCERCPLTSVECTERATPAIIWAEKQARERRRQALDALGS